MLFEYTQQSLNRLHTLSACRDDAPWPSETDQQYQRVRDVSVWERTKVLITLSVNNPTAIT